MTMIKTRLCLEEQSSLFLYLIWIRRNIAAIIQLLNIAKCFSWDTHRNDPRRRLLRVIFAPINTFHELIECQVEMISSQTHNKWKCVRNWLRIESFPLCHFVSLLRILLSQIKPMYLTVVLHASVSNSTLRYFSIAAIKALFVRNNYFFRNIRMLYLDQFSCLSFHSWLWIYLIWFHHVFARVDFRHVSSRVTKRWYNSGASECRSPWKWM